MASVLFGAHASLAVLPLMLFHQMQLMVCAVIAKRRAHDPEAATTPVPQSQRHESRSVQRHVPTEVRLRRDTARGVQPVHVIAQDEPVAVAQRRVHLRVVRGHLPCGRAGLKLRVGPCQGRSARTPSTR